MKTTTIDIVNSYWRIIKKHLKNILLFFISINIVAMLSFSILFTNYSEYLNDQMTHNITEYNEIDREQLCKIANCSNVLSIDLKKCWIFTEDEQLTSRNYIQHNLYNISDHLYIDLKYKKLLVYNDLAKTYFVLNIDDILNDYLKVMNIFVPISLLIFIFPLYISIKEEQEESLLILAGNEAILANKTMINITENIHHELNTPLEVIDNKIEKVHRILTDYMTEAPDSCLRDLDHKLITIEEDFEFIKTSSEQIYAVLEKMKGFKNLRYSNGNKSIRNIVDGGFKIINMSNSNFNYKVDKTLSNYTLRGKLKNADLLSIILNHIKNSLEANASEIVILCNKYNNNNLVIRIIDNGNGIPEHVKSDIFKPNFTTKAKDSGVRGNGMYLNKHILKDSGGDIKVVESSVKGTTIELTIPVNEK